jgi:hypothetical protein
MTQIIDYIYALYEVESKTKFYIGRTIDPHRRLNEHRLGSKHYKDGDEAKYLYANCLDALGIQWDMEILCECGPDTEDYEDFYVNKFRHEPLQNMRAGDSEPWMGRDYPNPEEFVLAKKRYLDRQKFKQPRERKVVETNPEETLYSFEKPAERFMSPVMREVLAKRSKK